MIRAKALVSLRRVAPSLSLLTYNPFIKLFLNSFDILTIPFSEFHALPPNHLRVRIGVGNKIFNNQVHYISAASSFWLLAFSKYGLTLESNILDIGCGCGRYAFHIRDLSVSGDIFRGKYVGVDIDEEMVNWCLHKYDGRFKFVLSTDKSSSYNRNGTTATPFYIPEPGELFDFVFSTSLFTHLLEHQLEHYLRETYRLLKPNGVGHHSLFLADRKPRTFGVRHSFLERVGNAYVESLKQPEAAVAYDGQFIKALAESIGFREVNLMQGGIQSVLHLVK